MYLNTKRDAVHAANVEAGWWTDLNTGQSILDTRNRPEMLCLITSELCEAVVDGFAPDSHLPQYPAVQVEIADAAIRILDLAGAEQIDLTAGDKHRVVLLGDLMKDTMAIVILVSSYALEGVRKGKTDLYHQSLADAYTSLWHFADVYEFDLKEVIDAKMEYNANRADHKIENRKAEGGKKI